MTQISQDPTYNFTDLERNRLLLEENVLKLSRSLQHWRTWEAEYEGLKEEILNAGDDPTNARLVFIHFYVAYSL